MRDRPGFRRLFRLPLRRPAIAARDVDDEIRSHLEQSVEHLVARGLTPEAARAEAERRFGELDDARRRLRAEAVARERKLGAREWLAAFRHDVAFAVRQARRTPAHTAMVVLVLALGIGASTAVFSVLNTVVLRPLPFAEPERIAVVWSLDSLGGRTQASVPTWRDWQEESRAFEALALYSLGDVPVAPATPGAEAFAATGAHVSERFFEVLRPRMHLGRAPSSEDDAAGRHVVAVSERFWRNALGGPAQLPVAVTVYGTRYDVVGVVASTHELPADADLWMLTCCSRRASRNAAAFTAVGRLAPGWTLAQATEDLDAVMAGIREREPDAMYAHGVVVEPLHTYLVGDATDRIRLVAAAGFLMLLIACANAAAASLVRGSARARELAIRASLGAGRRRILRQLVTEQLVLATASGALGLWLAHVGTRWLARAATGELPRMGELGFDRRVLAVAAGCSLLSAVLAGLLPMVLVRRASLRGTLAASARAGGGVGGLRMGRVLVGAEVAVAVVLLAGATLLVESFRGLVSRDLGYTVDRVATAKVELRPPRYETNAQRLAYLQALERSVRAVPGVTAVGFATAPPFGSVSFVSTGGVVLDGSNAADPLVAGYQVVSEDYFRSVGIPILAGRAFSDRDTPAAPRVTLVNRTMAERYWPGESPIGRRLRVASEGAPWLVVVGVVGDVRPRGHASEPDPEHYVPYRQEPGYAWGLNLVVRSSAPLDRVLPMVRARMRALDPAIPAELRALDEQLARSTTPWRLPMSIVSTFGLVALVLATLGVYTVFAFVVAQRTREIGVRLALGATSGAVLRATLRDALAVTAVGALVGSLVAWLLLGVARSLLLVETPVDVQPLLVAVGALIATATVAAYIPGRRASRVEPSVALRAE